jgi:hypothetical protein
LINNAWPTTEFKQETFILRSKSASFSSLNQVLPKEASASIKLSSFLLKVSLPFIENLTAQDYIRMKKDKAPYSYLRDYFKSIACQKDIDVEAEEKIITEHIKKVGKNMSTLERSKAKTVKTGSMKVTAPLCVCILSYFLFPPLMIPVSVWSFKETYDLFEKLVETRHKLERIKKNNSFFSLWKLTRR